MHTAMGSTFGDVATAVGAVATVGLFLAACLAGQIASRQLRGLKEQVNDGRAAEGRRRVFAHLGQLLDGDFVEMQTEATRLFGAKPPPADAAAWAALWGQKSDVEKSRITAIMNFYEVVAAEYNDPRGELLDKQTADKALSYIADAMWLQAAPFVAWVRYAFKERRAYAEWELLHETFTATQPKAGAPAAKVAVAAVPAQASQTVKQAAETKPAAAAPPKDPTTESDSGCPPDPCTTVPKSVLTVALLWLIAVIATFFVYIEIAAVAHFFPKKVGSLPISAIWFGAVGGLLVSLEGIFKYNRSWHRSYDYWHYARPVLGAIMGTIGCLIFIVLAGAASTKSVPSDATFYSVAALALGYREASFRALLTRLVDTVIVPAESKAGESASSSSQPSP